ncbi:hypothetical protein RhiirA5_382029 [Rhizophagus irregularis]|uniref:Uncharacterized protein n=1 Tax=Rhizophagus irregularis TaxID=588596 RepID=A0A2I1EZ98_9GLOM|nr:hypothetical protein RhiirA5_382029 [Rhizophagus irregularis]PKC59139.1 hypothetical protein RhiirA1_400173 [Rhizophagus irregularis]PKY27451.1 hypothetical protein RhiirB3_443181 [Rhizophagus irregularis]CAB4482968.1 unnamed protein product [Rhizophagus irregularis]CAB5365498.1 unnamed protein product [Rhizophagus irregularis]
MKLQSFHLPIAIFICACITFTSVTDAYIVLVHMEMIVGTNCILWVTDQNDNNISGDGPGDYHSCDNNDVKNMTFPDTSNYGVHAKVQGSAREMKDQGPYNRNTCYFIHGDVGSWRLDEASCSL